ncbi:MAG: hypothetical protein ACR2KO_08115 [Geodermatophilaceae bacterium]|jgi:hypothetical protein|nr:hypothetical protein [Geodermatophilaceae bacterium]
MDLESVVDELYALDPGEFTAIRTEREKQARADGDKELSRQIHQLRKPTITAWLANLLARERPDSLRPLRELARQLQDAQQTLQGDALRQLSRQRHQLVYALVQEIRELAAANGQQVTEQVARELEQTLDATLADPAAADAVLAGRLTTALQHSGFGPQSAVAPSRPGPAKSPTKTTPKTPIKRTDSKAGKADTDKTQRRREAVRAAAERAVEAAEQALQTAADAVQAAEDAADDLEHRQQELDSRITELQRSLTQAEEEVPGVRRAARRAQRDQDRARQARDRAERALSQARASLRNGSEQT